MTIKKLNVFFKLTIIFIIVFCWLFWNFLVALDTGNGSRGPFTWERSIIANSISFTVLILASYILYRKWVKRIWFFIFGVTTYGTILISLKWYGQILALFINPGPLLYNEIMENCPDQKVIMDTTIYKDFDHEAYYRDIRRWVKYFSLEFYDCTKK